MAHPPVHATSDGERRVGFMRYDAPSDHAYFASAHHRLAPVASTSPVRFEHLGASTLGFPGKGPTVTVTVLTPRIVRVEHTRSGPDAALSYVADREWTPTPFDLVDGDPVRLVTTGLRVEISRAPLRIAFLDSHDDWLLREPADAGMSVEPMAGDSGRRRVRASFVFSGEQHFYGLGQGGAAFDRLGATRQLWNTHIGHGPGSDMGVPLLVSSRGYALFFDNPGDAVVSVGRSDGGVRIVYTAEAGRLAWYFLLGGDVRGVMREVAELLGRPPMPPRWALGFLQSTRHFENTAELSQLAHTLREKRIPCDALIYLSTYGDALGWNRGVGHLEFQPTLWPDPAALLAEMRSQHFEVITHEYPVLHDESPLFAEAEARGYLLDAGYERASLAGANYRQGQRYVDFSDPAARAWWWSAHRELARSASRGGGSTAARVRRRSPRCGAAAECSCTTSTIGSATRPSPRARRATGPISACSCSAAPGPRACSASAPRAGRATSTTTSRRWRRRFRSA
jgi:Glycosyl hydrolases family 31/Domain of unknown function (DUF4968)/Galactose mutarotase-like